MPYHRRRLPHVWQINREVFLTWNLDGAIPAGRAFPGGRMTSGEEFLLMDRLLDSAREGPHYLSHPEIAAMVVDAIRYNAEVLRHYDLHAYVVMSNHVHLLVTALVPLPKLTRSLKGITAKRANEMLQRTGRPFWQVESYDRLVRDDREFGKVWRSR
jgi:hypothetical protein